VFRKLASHNPDLKRLLEKGYAVAYDSGYLIVRDIPHLGANGASRRGSIVAKLVFEDEFTVRMDNHQVWWAGDLPHGMDGKPIPNLGPAAATLTLSDVSADVVVSFQFSHKPKPNGQFRDYADLFEKIETYADVLGGPAMEKFGDSPLTFREVDSGGAHPIFTFQDTLTSRAAIGDLSAKFEDEVVAIIGLGGTGAYLLDFMVKTPVKEVRGFDGDVFHVHNTFRAPGRLAKEELKQPKADVYQERYTNFRHGLHLQAKYIDATSQDDLAGVTFAFVCVDKGSARKVIFELLIELGIPFIDLGMGLKRKGFGLNGMMRTTYFPAETAQEVMDKGWAEVTSDPDNLYKTNIQIGELNALNACLAVIRYKQIRGFYHFDQSLLNMLFEIADMKNVGDGEDE
jgi:hypothetical protein